MSPLPSLLLIIYFLLLLRLGLLFVVIITVVIRDVKLVGFWVPCTHEYLNNTRMIQTRVQFFTSLVVLILIFLTLITDLGLWAWGARVSYRSESVTTTIRPDTDTWMVAIVIVGIIMMALVVIFLVIICKRVS